MLWLCRGSQYRCNCFLRQLLEPIGSWSTALEGVQPSNSYSLSLAESRYIRGNAAFVQDLEDTTGSWELYGQEDEKRYPSLQAEFFNRAAAPLTRRESLLALTFVGAHIVPTGILGLLYSCVVTRTRSPG